MTRAHLSAKQGRDWKREGRQSIREWIELEVEWNEAREKRGLAPAPYPFAATPNQASQPEAQPEGANPNEDNAQRKPAKE